MALENRPTGRKKTYGTGGSGVHKKGTGLGTGPVGSGNGYAGRNDRPASGGGGGKRSGGGGGMMKLLILAAVVLLGGGGGLSTMLGGGSTGTSTQPSSYSAPAQQTAPSQQTVPSQSVSQQASSQQASSHTTSSSQSSSQGGYSNTVGGFPFSSQGTYTTSPVFTQSTGTLDENVADGIRDRYTKIKGNNADTVTIMVYMCGADLESRSGMASRDLQEMASASLNNINLIVYTGGASRWNNNIISNKVNQVYQVTGGGVKRLVDNAGTGAMTDPNTLASFIKYCANNFPADRNELIFWDHGAGSVSGYGYDEKNPRAGSMSLAGINQALKAGGMKFDFIGFDTCLMATMENGLMLSKYADYMVASEETEPGYGWYYTNWLNSFNRNRSMPTIEIGKQIVDDFVTTSAKNCPGQKATLSVVDLAELEYTAPDELSAFSKSISDLIEKKEYKTISVARNSTREFATTSPMDQVDLVDLAENMGTAEGKSLSKTLRSAIKYNRTSSNMSNAYGLSIYFPYRKISLVDSAVKNYSAIGLDDDYSKCIQEFASVAVSGQTAAGGGVTGNPLSSLFGDYTGYGSSYGSGSSGSYGMSYDSSEVIGQLLGSLLSSSLSGRSIPGLDDSNSGFLSERSLPVEDVADYIFDNHFETANLQWQIADDGTRVMELPEEQWSLVNGLELNMFYDDGEGYIDLGLDNTFEFTDDGLLIGDTDGTWLSIDGQVVAYYHMDTMTDGDQYTITGRVPCLLNGERVNLLIVFDNEHEEGYIAGAMADYVNGETDAAAKGWLAPTFTELAEAGKGSGTTASDEGLAQLQEGDTIQYLCDYYTYEGEYSDTYFLGDETAADDDMPIRNIPVGGPIKATYRFTDIYNQEYWTPSIDQ